MTFLEHLEELRWFFLRSMIVFILCLVFSFIYFSHLQYIMLQPFYEAKAFLGLSQVFLQDIKVSSPFIAKIIISLLGAVMVSFPYFILESCRFVYPSLSGFVSRASFLLVFILSIFLFVVGCLFGYFYLLPTSLYFFMSMINGDVIFAPERINYIFFSFWLVLICGIIFQLPIVSILLTKSRIINYEFLRQMRPYSLILILIVSALLSPPDPLSQILIALPLYLLYEVSVFISYVLRKKS